MKKFLSVFFCICSLLVIEACEPQHDIGQSPSVTTTARLQSGEIKAFEDPSVEGDYQVRDGILRFKSIKTFLALDTVLAKLDVDKRIEFTKKLGFKSLLDIRMDVFKSLSDAADAPEKYKQILQSNSDIVKDNGDRLTTIYSDATEHLLNREGMVSIGGKIHCLAKGKTIIGSSVKDVRESYKAGRKVNESIFYSEQKSLAGARPTAGPCATISRSAYNGDNNRRADIYATVEFGYFYSYTDVYGVEMYTLQWTAVTRGRAFKKPTFGNWTYYETTNTLNARYYISLSVQRSSAPPYFGAIMYSNTAIYINGYVNNFSTEANYNSTLYTAYDIPAVQVPGAGPSNIVYSFALAGDTSNLGTYITDGVPSGVLIDCF
jgi:hypothetical protein